MTRSGRWYIRVAAASAVVSMLGSVTGHPSPVGAVQGPYDTTAHAAIREARQFAAYRPPWCRHHSAQIGRNRVGRNSGSSSGESTSDGWFCCGRPYRRPVIAVSSVVNGVDSLAVPGLRHQLP